jgi:hypothetical protein
MFYRISLLDEPETGPSRTDDDDNEDIYYYSPTCFSRCNDYQSDTQEYKQYTTVAQNV